jgi:hypothetical protein
VTGDAGDGIGDTDDDLERLFLGRSPRFFALLNRSRQCIEDGKGLSENDFWEAVRKRARERQTGSLHNASKRVNSRS